MTSQTVMYVVQVTNNCWLVNGNTFNRTLRISNAKRYKTIAAAKAALTMARKIRKLQGATIEAVQEASP